MKIFFLEAPMPLTKQFSGSSAGVKKTAYPNAYEVTSHEEQVKDLKDFEVALKRHAALGHCLVKGELNRPLVSESRAGTTDSNASTSWVCLDVDGLPDAKATPDWLLRQLGLQDYSYIVQWSASYGIESKDLRCHLFLMLDKPYPAPLIKQWLIEKNLSTPCLDASLGLTKTGNAISWPLDISACQNDKLLYIAAPVLKGINDPLGTKARIAYIKRTKEKLSLGLVASTAKNREAMHKRLDELRQAEGLPKRKTTYKMHGSMEVMTKPDVCIVTETRAERGFVYFNLNGGDSWAYYHPEGNPDYIYNFKGEPVYLTKELLPEYWEELHKQTNRVDSSGVLKLAFLDPTTDKYWRGTYDTLADELNLHPTQSALALRHFCKANGIPLYDEVIPEWDLVFDPHDNVRVDIANRVINTFQPSKYMRAQAKKVPAMPKTIRRVLMHIVCNEQATFDHFVNWLAVTLQTRDRPQTAWLFHGVPGTGKGTLLNKILRPLFGHTNVAAPRMHELDKEFNAFIDRTLIVAVDEIEVDALQNEKGVMADLRRYVTEEFVPLRRMYKEARDVRNYTAWLFLSNADAPVRVPRGDRRMNIASYQPQKLVISNAELDKIETELQAFHDYLLYYQADADAARTPLENQARSDIMDLTESAIDGTSRSLNHGTMSWFIDQLPTDSRYTGDARQIIKVEDYKAVLLAILKRTDRNTGVCSVARDELRAIFEYTVGKIPESPNKFTSLVKHHGVRMTKVWVNATTVNGIRVVWKDLARWNEYLGRFAPAAKKTATKLVAVK